MTTDNPSVPPSDQPILHVVHHHEAHDAILHASQHAYDHTGTNVANVGEHHHHSDRAITASDPLKGLDDPRIEKVPHGKNSPHLEHRDKNDVTETHVRLGHKPGDPDPNYIIDHHGHVKELRAPDTKLNGADHAVTIEVEAGSRLNKHQQAALDGLEKAVKKEYPKSKDADATPEMQQVLDRTAAGPGIPSVAPHLRGGNVGMPHGPKDWGSHAGDRGGNGGRVPSAAEARARHEDVPYSAPVDYGKLGLDRNVPRDRIAAMISSNEGSPTTINWNDNGAGVSVGMFQANQKRGELPKLFSDFANTPQGFATLEKVFGEQMAEQIRANPEMVRGLNFRPGNQLGQELEQLVQDPTFQELQLNQLRSKIDEASQIAKQHGVTSEAGVALVADVINQFGEGGANGFLRAADGITDQEEKARAIARSVQNHSRYGGRYAADMNGKVAQNSLSFHNDYHGGAEDA